MLLCDPLIPLFYGCLQQTADGEIQLRFFYIGSIWHMYFRTAQSELFNFKMLLDESSRIHLTIVLQIWSVYMWNNGVLSESKLTLKWIDSFRISHEILKYFWRNLVNILKSKAIEYAVENTFIYFFFFNRLGNSVIGLYNTYPRAVRRSEGQYFLPNIQFLSDYIFDFNIRKL